MTEEIKNVEVKEETCFCKSKEVRKFLTIALGTFVGVFSAMSLFAALHKPPMMIPTHFRGPMMRPCPCHVHHHFDNGRRGDFHKKYMKVHCDKKMEKFEKKEFKKIEKPDNDD